METNRRVVKPKGFSPTQKLTDSDKAIGFNGVFFGPPGVGKTTLALTAQGTTQGGNVLLHDADQGRESVLDVAGAEYYVPQSWKELRENLDTALALKGDSPFKTHVFDSLSSMYHEHLMPMIEAKSANRDGRALYGEAQKEMTKFVRDARSLCEYGINTIFLGHQKEDRVDENTVAIRLSLPPSLRNDVLLVVNHVGYLSRVRRSEDRELQFTPPNAKVEGPKLRQTRSGEQVPLKMENPTMGKLFDLLRNSK